jgi:hypothetical protein
LGIGLRRLPDSAPRAQPVERLLVAFSSLVRRLWCLTGERRIERQVVHYRHHLIGMPHADSAPLRA